jgi:inosine/xanthosine triphosphate pyrophosphatase family protein
MVDEDQDAVAYEKIFEAAERIADMAQTRPAEAQRLLERAQYLRNLAEQIRQDWQRRYVPT